MADSNSKTLALSLGALGIVYGDLGTSPLYALQQILPRITITPHHVFGILSLVFWSLILVISTSYVSVFLRADNDGEGGVLALLSLLKRINPHLSKGFFLLGIIGAGLLLGDGMITPAISVLSAIEGLNIISPDFSDFIAPIAFVILLILFLSQRFGTTKIGFFFGPILFLWFIIIATLGGISIAHNPTILYAINPYYAVSFIHEGGLFAYALLGGVFLVITGAEAMYADLGHFGKNPIRIGWFVVALPALLLNYFGQGANLLSHPEAISNLFYSLAPEWFRYPLLVMATLATIIASQAVISASFSLARQAILLDICPRLSIQHTSKQETGQVYVPQVNALIAIGTLLLVIVFQSSDGLAAAFGMAVNLVMIIVATLVLCVARQGWHWSYGKIILIFSPLLCIDFIFLGANIHKISEGAWIPLVFAAIISTVLITWQKGLAAIRISFYKTKAPLTDVISELKKTNMTQANDLTLFFVTDSYDVSGGGFLDYVRLTHVIPQQSFVLSVIIDDRPYITEKNRFELKELAEGYYTLMLHYGFMQLINIPKALMLGNKMNVFKNKLDMEKITYLVENLHFIHKNTKNSKLNRWQVKLFAFLLRNSSLDGDFFHLPQHQTISIGSYIS